MEATETSLEVSYVTRETEWSRHVLYREKHANNIDLHIVIDDFAPSFPYVFPPRHCFPPSFPAGASH